MKCKKDENGCNKDCKFWIIHQKEPNKYMCITVPYGLYEEDTVLVDIEKNKNLLKIIFGD